MTIEKLRSKTGWLLEKLKERGVKVQTGPIIAKDLAKEGLKHLGESVKRYKEILQPRVLADIKFLNILLLKYYSNGLLHIFANECMIAVSMNGFRK